MIPLYDKNRRKHFPFFNIIFIFICVTVYIVTNMNDFQMQIFRFSVIPDRLSDIGEIYRLLTYMFLHGDLLHLIMNMLFLWVFGDNIEDRFGHIRYIEFIILAGIVSVLVQSGVNFISNDTHVTIIGASGAISAIMGAYLILFPRAYIVTLLFIFIRPLPAWFFLIIWFLYQFISVLFIKGSNIAYFAHISGFIFGVIWALVYYKVLRKRH